MLSKFGKIPALEKNWKPSDFNLPKFLNWIEEARFVKNRIYTSIMIKDMLHFELKLSQDLTTEILEDYEKFTDGNLFKDPSYNFEYSQFTSFGGLNEIRYV